MKRRTELISLAALAGPLVVVGVLLGVSRLLDFSGPSIQDTYHFEVLDTRFGFHVGTASNQVAGLDEAARQAYRKFELLDYLFLALYAVVLTLAIRAVTQPGTWSRKLAWLPVAAATFDALEDLTTLIALGSLTPSSCALVIILCAGIVKHVFFYAALAALAVSGAVFAWRRKQMRYKREDTIKQTYFSLRLALTLLVGMLLLALAIHAVPPWCAFHSISAYYYSPLQATFVGVLVAIGICLVVYQGTTYAENLLLDIAGFMAFIVAFAPTSKPLDDKGQPVCAGSYVSSDARIADIVWGNVFPLLLVAAVATFVVLLTRLNKDKITDEDEAAANRKEVGRLVAGLVAQVLVLGAFFGLRGQFEEKAHGVAATTLFVCIILVVLINHQGRVQDPDNEGKKSRHIYLIVAIVMAATLAACVLVHIMRGGWPHLILAIELGLIVEFAAFWAIQTGELKGAANRPPAPPNGAPQDTADGPPANQPEQLEDAADPAPANQDA
ncbi:hypothetical protein UK23_24290 [Lentzea aerocolonigenes]|uniref:LigA n=1 Tax=Lentzea aerocolonigenes TaxID=68170 RepID=A0A0F0GX83_LENAE|nr:hypothetical protein [Lentzea aerocolonigenes]KJK46033.1 hypothetical protein UK23_24290 [Lentzea aerocolonigenes]